MQRRAALGTGGNLIPAFLLALSDRTYQALLRAYPPAFRDRFAAEMIQVFSSLSRETCARSGPGGLLWLWLTAVWDWLRALSYQWWQQALKGRTGGMETNLNADRLWVEPLSPREAGVAVLPFLVFGISSLLYRLTDGLPIGQGQPLSPILIFGWFVFLGLGAGLLLGFPRWAFSYLAWALLAGWLYGKDLVLPLLGVIILALLVRRSLEPLQKLLAGLVWDWTLLFLGIYTLYAFVFMLYDENHHPYLLVLITATTLVISLGVRAYYCSTTQLTRVLALSGSLFLAAFLEAISSATWDYAAYYGLPDTGRSVNLAGVSFTAVLAALMLGIALLERRRLSRLDKSGTA